MSFLYNERALIGFTKIAAALSVIGFLGISFYDYGYPPSYLARNSNDSDANKSADSVSIEVTAEFLDRNFTYRLTAPSDPHLCDGIKVLVLVISRPYGSVARHYIRSSWMHDEENPEGVLTRFFIGQSYNHSVEERLQRESDRYDDIIRYEYHDSYDMLAAKIHAAYEWKERFCPQVPYLLKADDDTIIDFPRLFYFFNSTYDLIVKERPAAFICAVFVNMKPERETWSKYFVPHDVFPNMTYPPFCQGCSYLITAEGVRQVLQSTSLVKFLFLEDVLFTGLIARVGNVSLVNSKMFGHFRVTALEQCDENKVPWAATAYGVSPGIMHRYHQRMKDQKCIYRRSFYRADNIPQMVHKHHGRN